MLQGTVESEILEESVTYAIESVSTGRNEDIAGQNQVAASVKNERIRLKLNARTIQKIEANEFDENMQIRVTSNDPQNPVIQAPVRIRKPGPELDLPILKGNRDSEPMIHFNNLAESNVFEIKFNNKGARNLQVEFIDPEIPLLQFSDSTHTVAPGCKDKKAISIGRKHIVRTYNQFVPPDKQAIHISYVNISSIDEERRKQFMMALIPNLDDECYDEIEIDIEKGSLTTFFEMRTNDPEFESLKIRVFIQISQAGGVVRQPFQDHSCIFLGMDFGTTTSAIGICDTHSKHKDVDIIHSMPTIISFPANLTYYEVGDNALRNEALYPDTTFRSIKRLLNSDENYTLIFEQRVEPFTIAAKIMRLMHDHAKKYVERKIDEDIFFFDNEQKEVFRETQGANLNCVIAVPANANEFQRQVTRVAGQLAGFNKVIIQEEPSVAAMAYGLDVGTNKILAYDFGGGTTDISILKLTVEEDIDTQVPTEIEVLACQGDNHLGGDDFDECIVNRIAANIHEKTGVSIPTVRTDMAKDPPHLISPHDIRNFKVSIVRIFAEAEQIKKRLSEQESATVDLDNLFIADSHESISINFELTRKEFESDISSIVDKTIDLISNAQKQANMTRDEVQQVILVGGSTRVPLVESKVVEYFSGDKVKHYPNRELVVAEGAALYSSIRTNIANKTFYEYGILLSSAIGMTFEPFIYRGTTYPYRATKPGYRPSNDYDSELVIDIRQRRHDMINDPRDMEKLGAVVISEIPRSRARDISIDITFEIDEAGTLKVSAVCHTPDGMKTLDTIIESVVGT